MIEKYWRIDYIEELKGLEKAYDKAMALDVEEFAAWLRQNSDKSLLASGAGGSLPVASMGAHLHQLATGKLARAGEPMDLFRAAQNKMSIANLLVTAGGSNSDSFHACRHFGWTPNAAVFCGTMNATGADYLSEYDTPFFEYDLLPKVHGWVAVEALLGQAVVLARAFAQAYPDKLNPPPEQFATLLPNGARDIDAALTVLRNELGMALSKDRLIFLYGPETKAAALDLESKFAESGLGNLNLSEYRNFAHGRYQMILPEPEAFGVAALIASEEREIAHLSLKAIPEYISSGSVALPSGGIITEQLSALVNIMLIVDVVGDVRGIRPGWGVDNTWGDIMFNADLSTYFPVNK